jgi:hypothetical protein
MTKGRWRRWHRQLVKRLTVALHPEPAQPLAV